MKRLTSLILLASFAFVLNGCDLLKPKAPATEKGAPTSVSETSTATGTIEETESNMETSTATLEIVGGEVPEEEASTEASIDINGAPAE